MACKLRSRYLKCADMTTRLHLFFSLNDERFAVRTDCITEVIPLVNLTSVPKTEHYVCGLMNYRGESIPVIDAVKLLYDRTYNKKICTRIIVLTFQQEDHMTRVGLIAEKVNMTKKIDTSLISAHSLTLQNSPCLGEIISDQQGDIQIIDIEKIIPSESGCLKTVAS